ncbi:hypothetical protein [Pseudomonas fluorescens]|uniref:hypothetical protein n=1 Tax=Pseudomonas fluorescens TaxID=294 RepID=UPI003D258A9A
MNIANGANGRRITGLAAGANATDAVNVSQLNKVGQDTATALGGGAALNAATGAWTAPTYSTNTISATGASTGLLPSTNVGAALTNLSTSVTNTAAVAVKYDAVGGNAITLGATGGVGAPVGGVKITNLSAGALNGTSTDAVNGSQLFATNTAVNNLGTQTTTLGNTSANTLGGGATYSSATGITGFSQPINAISSTGAVGAGTAQTSVAGALTALNTDTVNTANIAVKYDAVGGNAITLGATGGAGAPAGGVKITNLSAGALNGTSTDAVNGSQLFATNQSLNNINNGAGIKYFHANSILADSTVTGTDSVAVGPAASSTATNAVAIGNGAIAGTANSIALGNGATTAAAVATVNGVINGTTFNYEGATPTGVLSVGSVGNERQISNVAAGQVTTTSTDAINGSQLFATNTAVTNLGTQTTTLGNTSANTLGGGATYSSATGITGFSQPINAISSTGAVGAGTAQTSVAGALSALNTDTVNTANIAVKYDAVGGNAITLGATGGAGAPAGGVKITNLSAGALNGTSTDAVNGSQLFATNTAVNNLGTQTTTLGNTSANTLGGGATYSPATGLTGFSQPINAISSTGAVAAGTGQTSVAGALSALNTDTVNTANIAVKYDAVGGNAITLGATGGAGAPAGGVKITNLSAGALNGTSTDAVNGSQLFATNQTVDGLVNNGAGIKYFHANSTLADSSATGQDSVAVGPAASSTAANAIAIGNGAVAGTANSIALGNGATTAAAVATVNGVINGTTFNYEGATPTGVLSVGSVGNERQISNVAAGQVTTTSTDAINGSQLFATNTAVTNLGTQTTTLGNTSANTLGGGATYSSATGLTGFSQPINAISSTGAVAAGTAQTSVAGALSALNTDTVNTANIAVKYDAVGGNAITLGATGGAGAPVGGVKITNLSAGALNGTSTDAVNGSQLFATNTAVNNLGTQTTALGNTSANTLGGGATYSSATGLTGFSQPINAISSTGAVGAGTAQTSVAGALTALNTDTVNTANIAVKYDVVGGNAITLGATGGAGAPAGGVKITNLSAGALNGTSTDAVNGSQLFATNQSLNNINNGAGIKYFHANSTLADSTATGVDSVAVGPAASSTAANAIAIGNGAVASTANSIALGNGATTAAAVATANGVINGTTFNYEGATPTGVLSVGSVGNERQITNVAAGRVSAASTDAVNGSQLFSTNSAVDGLGTQVDSLLNNGTGIKYFHSNSALPDSQANGVDSVAIGPQSIAAGANSFAAGSGSNATADGGLALGHQSQVQVSGGIALGEGSVANRALAPASGTIPVGSGAIIYDTSDATLLGSVSVGKAGSYRQITNVADATEDHDAVTLRQLTGAMGSLSSTGTRYFHANSTNPVDSLASGAESIAVGPATVVNGDNGIGIGNQASVGQAAAGGIAIGRNTQVLQASGIAMGSAAQASAEQSVALGAGANASQAMSVALGSSSVTTVGAETSYSAYRLASPQTSVGEVGIGTALGNRKLTGLSAGTQINDAVNVAQLKSVGDQVDQNTTDITNLDGRVGGLESLVGSGGGIKYLHVNSTGADSAATGTDSMALGPTAQASGNGSVAMGNDAKASADGSVALGTGANASQAMSVALGSNSVTTVGAETNYSAYRMATPQTSVGEVGIGTAAGNRKLTGLSAGTQDNDAVNVAQLKSVGNQVDQNTTDITNLDGRVGGLEGLIGSGGGIKYLHVNSTGADSAATGTDSMALGPKAQASGNGSVAMGNGAKASADGSVAVGSGASDDGRGAEAYTGKYSAANNVTSGTVSVGNAATGETRTVSNVADGKDANDAVNVRQLDGAVAESKQYTDDSIANLNGTAIQQGARISAVEGDVSNLKNGTDGMFQVNNSSAVAKPKATGVDSIAGGAGAVASGKNSAAVGTKSQATGENSVAVGNGAKASAKNSTALGANSVADRENSVSVGSVGNERQLTNIAAGTSGTDAVNVDQLTKSVAGITDNANAYTDQRYSELKNDIKKQDEILSAGIAGAMAMASLPQAYSPGASMTVASASSYRGQSSVAFGVSHMSGNGRWLTKLQGSTDTQRNVGVAVGVGYQW